MLDALLAAALALRQDPADLAERFRSDRIEEREEAEARLKTLGAAARTLLEKLAKDPDAEVVQRARGLIRRIELADALSPGLWTARPGLADRLAVAPPVDWSKVFFECAREGSELRARATRGDLRLLAPAAFAGAESTSEKAAVLGIAAGHGVTFPVWVLEEGLRHPLAVLRESAAWAAEAGGVAEAIPLLLPLLEDGNEKVRIAASEALETLRAPQLLPRLKQSAEAPGAGSVELRRYATAAGAAAVPFLRERLRHPSDDMREAAALALGELGAKEAAEDLERIARDPDAGVRAEVVRALGRAGRIGPLEEALADPRDDVRSAALEGLERLKSRDSVPTLLRVAEGKGAPGIRAIRLLGELGDSRAVPVLSRLLREPLLARSAALALARLDAGGVLPVLLEVLQAPGSGLSDPEKGAVLARLADVETLLRLAVGDEHRDAALHALSQKRPGRPELLRHRDAGIRSAACAAFEGPEAEAALAPLLADPEPTVRRSAVRALSRLCGEQAADRFREGLKDGELEVRLAAAEALCLLGLKDGVPVLLQEDRGRLALNAVRRPELWGRLGGVRMGSELRGAPATLLGEVARRAGLGSDTALDLDESRDRTRWTIEGPDLTAIDVLRYASEAFLETVFESDRLVMLPSEQAHEFWKRWWESEGKAR
jgi:HEAT repeat protein